MHIICGICRDSKGFFILLGDIYDFHLRSKSFGIPEHMPSSFELLSVLKFRPLGMIMKRKYLFDIHCVLYSDNFEAFSQIRNNWWIVRIDVWLNNTERAWAEKRNPRTVRSSWSEFNAFPWQIKINDEWINLQELNDLFFQCHNFRNDHMFEELDQEQHFFDFLFSVINVTLNEF